MLYGQNGQYVPGSVCLYSTLHTRSMTIRLNGTVRSKRTIWTGGVVCLHSTLHTSSVNITLNWNVPSELPFKLTVDSLLFDEGFIYEL